MLGLYVHIPFCKKICPYCDFYKMVASESLQTNYINALIKEMQLKKFDCISFDTLYIGGGTPSSLSLGLVEKLLCNLEKHIDLNKLKEFTFECNPEDITCGLLLILKKYKVTRISIGIQSFNDNIQKLIKREFSYFNLVKKIKLLKEFNFSNYSFDLMYGFFNQTIDDIKNDIDLLLNLTPKHISIYSLMIEDKTYFKLLANNNYNLECDENMQASMYQFIIDYLEKNNFFQYETSNFAVKGYESIHNQIYWNDEHYHSLGAGASSYLDKTRITMTKKIHEYIDSFSHNVFPSCTKEILSLEDEIEEYIMMNLRKNNGVSIKKFEERFHFNLIEYYPIIKNLIENEKLLELKGEFISIKKEYRYIANYVIVKIIASK